MRRFGYKLGHETKIGSSLLVMAVAGGALLPPVLAYIADVTHSIQTGYVVPLICFVVVLIFGLKGYKVKKREPEVLLET